MFHCSWHNLHRLFSQYDFLLRASIFEMLVLLPFGPVLWLGSQQVLLYIISSDVYQSITGVSVVCI